MECELIQLCKLAILPNIALKSGQLVLQFVDAVTSELYHTSDEILPAEFTWQLRLEFKSLLTLELPGNDEKFSATPAQLQVV